MDKSRHNISRDELEYRQMLQDSLHVVPSRRAVEILDGRISKVLAKLGVDTTQNEESINFQMDILGIYINSVSESDSPKSAGIFISATINGELVPYAYISAAKIADGRYTFPIQYWTENILDEGVPERL